MLALISLIIFGILQGLTEFLPVSSSGHLSVFQYFSSSINDNLSLNIAVHLGTLLTVCVYYRSDLKEILVGLFRWDRHAVHMSFSIVVASIPTGIIGLMMKKNAESILTNPYVSGVCLLITAIMLFLSDKISIKENFQEGFGIPLSKAFIIGIVQGFAVLPGISRSGSTIIAGLMLGMNPRNASRFSFLISLPAILGAGLLEFKDLNNSMDISSFVIGGITSFLVGLFAISWMVKLTLKGNLKVFSYYLFAVAGLFLCCLALGVGKGLI